MLLQNLDIDRERLGEICGRYGVKRLEAFGSLARGDAGEGSDLDILVTFTEDTHPGLDVVSLQDELEDLFGRPVDLLTRRSVQNSPNKYFRRFALRETEPIYESAWPP